jgi:acetyltransferase-like isoleucine patch superfamily enzyme
MIMSTVLYKLYRIKNGRLRNLIVRIISRIEHGQLYSKTMRKIFKDYHGVEIGMYTHGSCFVPGNFDRFTTVGRYCSIAANVKVFNRDHPMDFKSMHAFFFNSNLKYTKEDLVEYSPLVIGNDVWLGDGVKIMPQVTNIGDGAVIGAGAVVNKDVPPYAVVVGNPARVVRYRFSKEVIESLLESKWWEKDIEEILPDIKEYQQPYEKLYFNKRESIEGDSDVHQKV